MVGRARRPIVTTVAPTIPVEAAKNAPTITIDTARPPGSGPNTRAIVVSSSSAMRERSSTMPIMTNISTASRISMELPASTFSLIRLTMKPMFRSSAVSQPCGNKGASKRGSSGYLNTEIASGRTPSAISARYASDRTSTAAWISRPELSSAAIIAKEITAAPLIAKATGKPDRIPANSVRKRMMMPISMPSKPKSMISPSC